MRFVLLVLDTHGSTEAERMSFYAELQRTKRWSGWDCLPHTFVARFAKDLAEAREPFKHLDIPDDVVPDSTGIATTDDEIRAQVTDDLRQAAAASGITHWRARMAITDSRPFAIGP